MKTLEVREHLVEALLAHAARPNHPSHQILDRVERALVTRDAAASYVDILLTKSATNHPSLRILDRAERLVRRIEMSHVIHELISGEEDDGKEQS